MASSDDIGCFCWLGSAAASTHRRIGENDWCCCWGGGSGDGALLSNARHHDIASPPALDGTRRHGVVFSPPLPFARDVAAHVSCPPRLGRDDEHSFRDWVSVVLGTIVEAPVSVTRVLCVGQS